MKVTALAPWFGAKRNLANTIVELLGPHRVYWEPFCGSMAVLLAKPQCHMETVNDLHEDLINLARVLQDPTAGAKLYRRLRRVLVHEEIQKEARANIKGDYQDGGDRAFWYFIESWLGRNGVSGTQSTNNGFCRRYTGNGGSPAVRFGSAIESIPAWRRRLRRVCICKADSFEVLEKIADESGTAIYVDPPYFKKGARYIHDFRPEDHERLADHLRRFQHARVVLSYYEDPRLDALYPGWAQHKIQVNKALAHQGARGKNETKAVEVLLVNGRISQEPTLFTE